MLRVPAGPLTPDRFPPIWGQGELGTSHHARSEAPFPRRNGGKAGIGGQP